MNLPFNYVPPVQEPVLEKNNDLDWGALPSEPSDLNYRPAVPFTSQDAWQIFGWMCLATFLALPTGWLMQAYLGKVFLMPMCFAVAFLFACGCGLTSISRSTGSTGDQEGRIRETLWSFLLPLQLWSMMALAPLTSSFWWAVGYFLVIAVPPLFRLVDQFSVHLVHWVSADPKFSTAAMNLWRTCWGSRFDLLLAADITLTTKGSVPLAGVKIYWAGWKAVAGGFVAGLCVALFLLVHERPLFKTGFWFFTTFCAVTVVLGWLTLKPCCITTWLRLFVTWFVQGRDAMQPNWVFQSPTGPPSQRMGLLVSAIWFTALSCCFLTDHFSWLLTCDPLLQSPIGYLTDVQPGIVEYLQRGRELAVFYLVLAFVACMLAPIVLLLLVAYVVTSPLIHHLQTSGRKP